MAGSAPQLQTLTSFPGIITDPNSQTVKPGSCSIMSNLFIVRDDIVQNRRGIFPWSIELPVPSMEEASRMADMYFFDNDFLIRTLNGRLYHYDGAAWELLAEDLISSYSTNESLYRIWSAFSGVNLYLAGGNFGIKKVVTSSGPVVEAGVPQGLDGTGTTSGMSGWFLDDTNVNYCIVFGKLNRNNQLLLGAPSDTVTITNISGGDRVTDTTFNLPFDIDESDVYRIYRSALSPDVATPAPSDMFLVFEGKITSTDISNGYVAFTDNTPELIRQNNIPLYTNIGTGGGAESANTRPPTSLDLSAWRNRLWFANTRSPQEYKLTLLAVGGGSGIQNGDTLTVTVDGVPLTFTGTTGSENIATGTFHIETGGTVSENLDITTKSLIRVCNLWADNDVVYMNNLSGVTDTPGKILIRARTWDVMTFFMTSSNATCFFPNLPPTGETEYSTNTATQHYVRYSKDGEFEAVPQAGTNFLPIGTENFPCIRILPLVNSQIVFKEGEGVWRISGTSEQDFRVDIIDAEMELLGPKAAALLNNTVVAYTNQGLVQIFDDGSAPLRSRNIETELRVLQNLDNFVSSAWLMTYPTEKQVLLFVPTEESDFSETNNTYVWNYIADNKPWTGYNYQLTAESIPYAGIVMPTNNLMIPNADRGRLFYACGAPDQDTELPNNFIYKERKSYTKADAVDEEWEEDIDTVAGDTITLDSDSTYGLKAGLIISQGSSEEFRTTIAEVIAQDEFTTTDEIEFDPELPLTISNPITVRMLSNPINVGSPTLVKQFTELFLIFRAISFKELSTFTNTDFNITPISETFVPTPNGNALGTLPLGEGPFGGAEALSAQQVIRLLNPQQVSTGHWILFGLTQIVYKEDFQLEGIGISYVNNGTDFHQ